MIVGMKEELSVPEEKEKKKIQVEGRQATAGTGSENDASGGHESNQQSILTAHTHTHTRGVVKPAGPDMLLCAYVCVCVCVCVCVIRGLKMETEDVGPSLSVCLHSV